MLHNSDKIEHTFNFDIFFAHEISLNKNNFRNSMKKIFGSIPMKKLYLHF